MTKAKRTWVIVADAARARFFLSEGPDMRPLDDATFENPAAHGHSRDLVSDKPGRSIESVGGARHAEEPKHDPHRAGKAAFARRMADFVEQNARDDKFDDLVMVAPPQLLGDLRHALGRHAAARLIGAAPKDLMKIPAAELKSHLKPILAAAARRPLRSA